MKGQPVLGCEQPTATPDFTLKQHVPGILDKRFQGYLKEPVVQVRHAKNGDYCAENAAGNVFCLSLSVIFKRIWPKV